MSRAEAASRLASVKDLQVKLAAQADDATQQKVRPIQASCEWTDSRCTAVCTATVLMLGDTCLLGLRQPCSWPRQQWLAAQAETHKGMHDLCAKCMHGYTRPRPGA